MCIFSNTTGHIHSHALPYGPYRCAQSVALCYHRDSLRLVIRIGALYSAFTMGALDVLMVGSRVRTRLKEVRPH